MFEIEAPVDAGLNLGCRVANHAYILAQLNCLGRWFLMD